MITSGASAILLAAGYSSRMGKLKALLHWQGIPLINYQIEQMQEAGITDIVVVLGYQAEKLQSVFSQYDVKAIVNKNYQSGKSSSIREGVSSIYDGTEGILVSAVDQPVPSSTLKKLLNCLKTTQTPAVIPVYKGKRGHPILFHQNLKDDLLMINEKEQGLRGVIRKYNKQIAYVEVDDPAILLNFNKPGDYLEK